MKNPSQILSASQGVVALGMQQTANHCTQLGPTISSGGTTANGVWHVKVRKYASCPAAAAAARPSASVTPAAALSSSLSSADGSWARSACALQQHTCNCVCVGVKSSAQVVARTCVPQAVAGSRVHTQMLLSRPSYTRRLLSPLSVTRTASSCNSLPRLFSTLPT